MMENSNAGFHFLDHTADAKFQAFGRTIEEAFTQAAYALLSLMWDRESLSPQKRVRVRKEGLDEAQLLLVFLEEILFLRDARAIMVGGVEEVRIEPGTKAGYILTASFTGEEYGGGCEIYGDVKAVTYSDMVIEHLPGGTVLVQVVLDI